MNRFPSNRLLTETVKQFRPTVGSDARGGPTTTNAPQVVATGETLAGFPASFKYTGVAEVEQGGAVVQVQTYALVCGTRDLRQGDYVTCPALYGDKPFRVADVATPRGGFASAGTILTATCYLYQQPASLVGA